MSTTAAELRAAGDALHAIADTYDAAQAVISGRIAGFKTSTPGAAPAGPAPIIPCTADVDCRHFQPCPIHEPDSGPSTPVERLALSSALDDPTHFAALSIGGYIPNLAMLTVRTVRALEHTVRGWAPRRPKEADACVSCQRAVDPKTDLGHYTPRVQGSRYCTWCRKKKGELDGHEPPLDMLSRHLAGHTVTAADVTAARLQLRSAKAQPSGSLTAACPHPICETELTAGEFACRLHWLTLRSSMRLAIEQTWRRIKAGDKTAIVEYETAVATAIDHWWSQL